MFNKLKEKYRNEGIEIGKKIGYQNGYSKALEFAVEYYEGTKHDQYIKQEVDKVENKPTDLDYFRDLEQTMTWLNCVYDIADSDFFRVYLFETTDIKAIENMIDYLNYLSMNEKVMNAYPMSYEFLPEIIMSLHEVIDHKLLVEEAEKVLKSI